MNHHSRKLDKKLLVWDLAAVMVSFLLALAIRYQFDVERWQVQLYSIVCIGLLIITTGIHIFRVPRGKNPPIYLLDPVDIFVEYFHNQLLLAAVLAVFLILTNLASQVSRRAILYFFICNLVIGYLFRILYWKKERKQRHESDEERTYLLVTTSQDLPRAYASLRASLSAEERIWGVALVQEASENNRGPQRFLSEEAGQGMPECDLVRAGTLSKSWQRPTGAPQGLEAFVYLPEMPEEIYRQAITTLNRAGLNVLRAITTPAGDVMGDRVRHCGCYGAVYYDAMQQRGEVLGVPYVVTTLHAAGAYMREYCRELSGQYLCFSNVHTTVMAREDEAYRNVLLGAAFVFPDGMPVARQMKKTFPQAARVPGPDFMQEMFTLTQDGSLSHFFYGSTEETLQLLRDNLEKKYPGLRIAGMYSPPFRPLNAEEDQAVIRRINDSGADIVWIGLGAPRQENWMAAHKGKIHGLMAGVGAGFNFHAGNIRRAPYWVQKIGMEWLYRLFQDPKRLFSRYLVTNTKFLWYIMTQKKHDGKAGKKP